MKVILTAMSTFTDNSQIHRCCCKVIAVVSLSVDIRKNLISVTALESVLGSIQLTCLVFPRCRYPQEPDQCDSSGECVDIRKNLISVTTLKSVLGSMQLFPVDLELQIIGCGTLACLLEKTDLLREKLIEQGGITLIGRALSTHQTDSRLAVVAVMALDHLMPIDLSQHSADATLAKETILKCMRSFSENKEVQISGCRALGKLEISAESDIIEVATNVIEAIRRHGREPEVQKSAAAALRPYYKLEPFSGLLEKALHSPTVNPSQSFWHDKAPVRRLNREIKCLEILIGSIGPDRIQEGREEALVTELETELLKRREGRTRDNTPVEAVTGLESRTRDNTPVEAVTGLEGRTRDNTPVEAVTGLESRTRDNTPVEAVTGLEGRTRDNTPVEAVTGLEGRTRDNTPVEAVTGLEGRTRDNTPVEAVTGLESRTRDNTPVEAVTGREGRTRDNTPVEAVTGLETELLKGREGRTRDNTPVEAVTGLEGRTRDNTPVEAVTGLEGRTRDNTPVEAVTGLEGRTRDNTPVEAVTGLEGRTRDNTPVEAVTGLEVGLEAELVTGLEGRFRDRTRGRFVIRLEIGIATGLVAELVTGLGIEVVTGFRVEVVTGLGAELVTGLGVAQSS
ncbi:hypothetical protein RRG08_060034 [Elysia crispata]|uniref:Uncharacterized protein n=1 Tax=Elysia crispata TaxID=231223 RepID=A0AAE0YDW0_9GAST|nr:hypothetical protein RRG08_060034 [Elysia crispata]